MDENGNILDERVDKLAYSLDDEIRGKLKKAIGIILWINLAIIFTLLIFYDQRYFGPVWGFGFAMIPAVVGFWFIAKKSFQFKTTMTVIYTVCFFILWKW